MDLKGKCVLLGVSGGIAAYKMANVASALRKLGADVEVIIDVYKRQGRLTTLCNAFTTCSMTAGSSTPGAPTLTSSTCAPASDWLTACSRM